MRKPCVPRRTARHDLAWFAEAGLAEARLSGLAVGRRVTACAIGPLDEALSRGPLD